MNPIHDISQESATEQWREIPGHHGYLVSDLGRVRSLARDVACGRGGKSTMPVRERILRPRCSKTGYPQVSLGKGGTQLVHKLVMISFRGPRPIGCQIAHNDGDRTNPRLSNLRWDTVAGNHADKKLHGTWQGREQNPAARLNAGDVAEMRALAGTIPRAELAAKHGVSVAHASKIITGGVWGAEGALPVNHHKMSHERAAKLRARAPFVSQKALAEEFAISPSLVSRILSGEHWS
jgi:hypothetical protein